MPSSSASAWLAIVSGLVAGCGQAGGVASGASPATATGKDSLVVFHAGSLNQTMAALAGRFEQAHPGAVVLRESGGSVGLAERARDSARTPDVLAVADYAIIPQRLLPRYANWYAAFARNALVLGYTERSRGAAEITSGNWMEVLQRPDIRAAHSDPALDPGGYRALLLFQLAEAHYDRPGLAARLSAAVPTRTPAAPATLYDELQGGQLDYVVTYRSSALSSGLKVVDLPREVDLSDPTLADAYARAVIRVASRPGAPDSVSIRGEPIVYGITILAMARHPDLARSFVQLLLSREGADALVAAGLLPIRPAMVQGRVPDGLVLP
jgi:molybdate/tungstate transport system substrate-binding protein